MDASRQILAVLFVLILLGGALWAMRRGTGPLPALLARAARDRAPALQVTARLTLTPQHSLHVIRAGAREWVVATHPQGCTVISDGQASGVSA